MPELFTRCGFCYRRAERTLVQRRRTAWQVLARRPARRAAACMSVVCQLAANEYLSGREKSLG